MIEAEDLRKAFGAVTAVSAVSLLARDGCITGLVGPNGAGKSTTLRILATILRPDAGDARIDAISAVADPVAARRRLGVLPHGAGIYPHLTARENILYFGALHGLTRAECRRRAAALIDAFDLGALADRPARRFSQGERLKTALARALVHHPQNLLLDEPTSGLDVMAVRSLRALLLAQKTAGRCVLLSSHVMQEVTALCDEVVVIAHGTVLGAGAPQVLRELTGAADLEGAFVQLLAAGGAGGGA